MRMDGLGLVSAAIRAGTAADPSLPNAVVASPRSVLDSSLIKAIKGSTACRLPLAPSARTAAERTPVLESLNAFRIVSKRRPVVSSVLGAPSAVADCEAPDCEAPDWESPSAAAPLADSVPQTPPSAAIAASLVPG